MLISLRNTNTGRLCLTYFYCFPEKPATVKLVMTEGPCLSGTLQRVSCVTDANQPQLQKLQLQFPSRNLTIERYPVNTVDGQSIHFTSPLQDYWATVSSFPAHVHHRTVLPLSAKANRIDVTLRIKPIDDGTKVICKAIGVSWPMPTVADVRSQRSLKLPMVNVFDR